MDITMLGTGHAFVTECYNTCFVLSEGGRRLLVDGGGGSGLLRQMKLAGIDWRELREIFVTHKHMDHLTGILWMMRLICQFAKGLEGEYRIYGHDEVIAILTDAARRLLPEKDVRAIGDRLLMIPVEDGETRTLIGRPTTFFDIHSTKAKQFGFCMELGDGEKGRRLTCCGDEPYNDLCRPYVEGGLWLLHEAFCLHAQADVYGPYEKHHSTVKDACELAERLSVENLLLYHTEDDNITRRKELYTAEGREYFHGGLYVPDDLEMITIQEGVYTRER